MWHATLSIPPKQGAELHKISVNVKKNTKSHGATIALPYSCSCKQLNLKKNGNNGTNNSDTGSHRRQDT